jgi:RNA polymerase sigma factor (sigma-70 family)
MASKRHSPLELLGAAYEGWLDAVKKYDPLRGKFRNYANRRITGAIWDYLRTFSLFPRGKTHCISDIGAEYLPVESHYERIARANMLDCAERMINELPEREANVIRLYYFEELKLREIGALMGLTESSISLIKTKAINNLRMQAARI